MLTFVSGIWLEIPPPSLSPVILNSICWLDAVNIPFLWICICLLILYVLLPIECILLIAVFSCLKQAFILTFCLFFYGFFFFFFHGYVTNGFSVKLSCVNTFHSLTSVLYLVRLVFHAKHGGGADCHSLWNFVQGSSVLLTNVKPRPKVKLVDPYFGKGFFYWSRRHFSPQNVSVHCVAALLSFGGFWDIWYEALAVLYCLNQRWRRFFFFFFVIYYFCKLFCCDTI